MSSDPKARYALVEIPANQEWDWDDNVATFGTQMALIHNVFIRCLNSIHYHAPLVKPGDELSFVGYCQAFTSTIHDHHHGEEEIIFPFLQDKFDMKSNVDQHTQLTENMGAFEAYLDEVKSGKEKYDGEKAQGLVESFGQILVDHLHDEIPTLSPERLGSYEKKDLDRMVDVHLAHIKQSPLTTTFVLVFTHHDFNAEPTWPPLPGPVGWIIRNVAFWRHYSYWKFSPFTRQSQPLTYV